MSLCRPIVVMAQGRLLLEGDAAQVQNDPRVIEAYLGGALEPPAEAAA
jgi:branched-chain amino acid transport system ATP-binding protein